MSCRIAALLSSALVFGSLLGAPAAGAQESGLEIGWHVPWAVGGPRLADDGSVYQHPGEWPEFAVRSLRLWDTRTAWLHLQPRADRYDFSNLDAHLDNARARGVEHVTLVLAGTPRWAAQVEAPTDAPWLGPGSASPPRSLDIWTDFVETLVGRYAGRIDAYEIGNEPNLRMFWNGDYRQLGAFVNAAARVIRERDPSAIVVAPALLVTELRDTSDAPSAWSHIDPQSIDALSFHFYPNRLGRLSGLHAIVRSLRRAADASGHGGKPMWMTEVSVGSEADEMDMRLVEASAVELGIERLNWYAWMHQ